MLLISQNQTQQDHSFKMLGLLHLEFNIRTCCRYWILRQIYFVSPPREKFISEQQKWMF
jgi:hypothetical protein